LPCFAATSFIGHKNSTGIYRFHPASTPKMLRLNLIAHIFSYIASQALQKGLFQTLFRQYSLSAK